MSSEVDKPYFVISDEEGNVFVPKDGCLTLVWPNDESYCVMSPNTLYHAVMEHMDKGEPIAVFEKRQQ